MHWRLCILSRTHTQNHFWLPTKRRHAPRQRHISLWPDRKIRKQEPGHPPWPRFLFALGRRLFQPFAVCLGCTGLSIKRKKRNLGSLMMCFQYVSTICFQYVSNTHRIHGAGIYTNIGGILMVNVPIYGIHGSYGIWFHGCFVWLHKTMSGMTVSAAILHGHKIKSSRSFPGCATEWMSTYFVIFHDVSTYWCLVGNGWEWGNGMIINSYCGSFPHSLLSTSKTTINNYKLPRLTK